MDLSSLFGSDALQNYANIANGMSGLYGGIKGAQTANNVNQGVQQGLGQNTAALQQQIDALTQQTAQNRQQAQDMYQRSLTDVTGQNQGLQGNIDTMTANLNSLSDPNSAYMQQARQAIERKDAAAGRNSQWGDRETQLAAALAQQVAQYSPGLQNSITGARNQINQNNQGLASLYSTANQPADRNTLAQIAALQQQLQNVNAQNTTGRGAANAATNSIFGTGGAVQSGLGALQGLAGLFNNSGSAANGITSSFDPSVYSGITGYGNGVGSLYGTGVGSAYDIPGSGYGSNLAGDYFGGGGLGGVPMGGYGAYDNSGPAINDIDW